MMILATQLNSAPIISGAKGKVATADFVLFHHEKPQVVAFVCQKKWQNFFSPVKIVAWDDVVSLENNSIFIKDGGWIKPATNNLQVKKVLSYRPLISKKVYSTDKKYYGRVTDALFDSQSGTITKLYLSGLMSQRIIAIEKVVKIHPTWVEINAIVEEATAEGALA